MESNKSTFADRITVKTMRAAVRLLSAMGNEDARHLLDPAGMAGLIEGAILGTRLLRPDQSTGSLALHYSNGANWLAHDINRPKEFPSKANDEAVLSRINSEGKLVGFILDEVVDNSSNVRTPTALFNAFNADHLLSWTNLTNESLLEYGFAIRRSYEQAYETAGHEKLIPELRSFGVADIMVYQVTPKGNGLLHLIPQGGDPEPKKQKETALRLSPNIAFS